MSTVPAQRVSESVTNWKIERTICSESDKAVSLIRELLTEMEKGCWSNREVFGIHMAMEEALMNAIKHGNCHDCKKCVQIEIVLNGDSFYAKISDEGEGFVPADVPDPTLEENLESESGRGLALIRNFVDEVRYNQKGNSVELFKYRAK